jgi:serine/threonine protein phosphatase PrpC
MKSAVLYEEAKRLYVHDGFSLDAIVELLKNQVSRKTLYNWKTKYEWDKEREQVLKQNESLKQGILEIAQKAVQEAKANPTPHNIYAVVKAISALKLLEGVSIDKEESSEDDKPKTISKETIEFIQKEILGV